MKKIISTLFVVFISHTTISAQSAIYQYQEGKSYCTIEIDTTLAINLGTFRALEYLDMPYYEMTFKPEFQYTEEGDQVLTIIPTFHYHAYLEKVHGEVESGGSNDKAFKLRFKIDPTGNHLTYISDDTETKLVFNRSTFSKKKHIDFTQLPSEFSKTDRVDFTKFPKGLRSNLQKRMNAIKGRLNR